MAPTHFGPELFDFLHQLRRNNNRDWFSANKERYERDVRDPVLRFISDLGPLLQKISPHVRADSRPVGGSLFRIYRDVRFSKDKSPYKTHAAAQFRHKRAKDVHAPGYYLHLASGDVLGGAGIWRPDAASLRAIRKAIVERGDEWSAILRERRFRDTFTPEGDVLKRPPKGFDPDHPLIDELKRKDHVAVVHFTEDDATAPGFLERYAEACRLAASYCGFLASALGLEW